MTIPPVSPATKPEGPSPKDPLVQQAALVAMITQKLGEILNK